MRRMGIRAAIVTAATAFAAGSAMAADAARGETIARLWCAACHAVSSDQTQAKADAPPFATIARTHTGADLRAFLANPYPRMPNMSLTRDEIDDLVGFMKTQGSAPGETPEAPSPRADPKPPTQG